MPYSDPKTASSSSLRTKASSSAVGKSTQKYPSTLSKQGGPSKAPSRKPSRKAYPAPSIDDVLPTSPLPPTSTVAASSAAVVAAAVGAGANRAPHPLPAKPKGWTSTIQPRSSTLPPAVGAKVLGNSTRANITPSASAAASGTSTPRKATPAPPGKAEYSSLQHLLEQAGYKETRIYTPPTAKPVTRKVKKTFDEVDPAEVDALYSVFGLPRDSQVSHMTITEPSMPLKSSSSILRSIAIASPPTSPPLGADRHVAGVGGGEGSGGGEGAGSPRSLESWWGGGFAALGRAAKAVMDMSPPKKEPHRYARARSIGDEEDDGQCEDEDLGAPGSRRGDRSQDSEDLHAVGLGLAKGGEGVRKVKSNWELSTSTAPTAAAAAAAAEATARATPVVKQRGSAIDYFAYPYGTPPDLSPEELVDFNGLPNDYEAQEDDDELYGAAYENSSLGSTRSTDSGGRGSPEGDGDGDGSVDSQDWKAALAMIRSSADGPSSEDPYGEGEGEGEGDVSLDDHNLGARVMAGAVDYDEEYEDSDSPTKSSRPTSTGGRTTAIGGDWTLPLIAPNFARRRTPSPTPPPETPPPVVKPVLKYGDRATKLRIAKSQPALRPQPSWMGSLKSAIGIPLLPSDYTALPTSPLPEISKTAAPIKLSKAIPAAPALVTAIPIVCDSASQEAVDLPALPSAPTSSASASEPVPSGIVGQMTLRARSSLAKLRVAVESAVGIPPVPPLPTNDDGSPVLSPRMDWGLHQEPAPWGRGTFQTPARSSSTCATSAGDAQEEGGGSGSANVSIDYTKSFFYKPPTPPHASNSTGDECDSFDAPLAKVESAERPGMTKRKSIKSLRAALLIPVAPPPPPVPPMPATLKTPKKSGHRTPPLINSPAMRPPLLAILSPGAWERGLPPRELVLEGEEYDAYMGGGDWGAVRRKKSGGKKVKRKGSKKSARA